MAAKVKEGALTKEKSISAPSTPRRADIRHLKRSTIDSLIQDPSMLSEKPIPNYLKPTISSGHHTNCHYPKKSNSQPQEAATTAGKPLPRRKPADEKLPSPSSLGSRVPSKTGSGDRMIASSKPDFENGSKKTLMRVRSLPKVTTKKRETNIDNLAKKSNDNDIRDRTHEEDKNERSETAKTVKTHKGKTAAKNLSNSSDSRKSKVKEGKQQEVVAVVEGGKKFEQEKTSMLKKQEVREKETPPMYNEVIEETATKLAAKRSKVKALVGAFETVISLQEPEGQLGQPHVEEAEAKGRDEAEKMSKDGQQQSVETEEVEEETKNNKVDRKSQQDMDISSKGGQTGENSQHEEVKEADGKEGESDEGEVEEIKVVKEFDEQI